MSKAEPFSSAVSTRARCLLSGALWSCLLCFVLPGCSDGAADGTPRRESPPAVVQTLRLSTVEITERLSAVGSLESPQTTEISAEFAGKVVFLDVPEGEQVKKGHVLARLDMQQAEAAVSVAKARNQNAKDRLTRLRQLRSDGVISEQEFDDAFAELDTTAGQLADATTSLDKRAVRAPFAGILGLRHVSLGAYVDAGDPIVRLTQVKPLDLEFSLPQRHLSRLQIGQIVRGVAGSCDRPVEGTITVIAPHIDPSTRTLRAQARVANRDGRLRPGMAVAIKIEVGRIAEALRVPQEAVVHEGTRSVVYTVNEDTTTSPHEVVLGEFFPDAVQILQGLEEGMTVIVAGHQKLRPDSKVTTEPYRPVENPNVALGSSGSLAECKF